jgi:hypothetical protein
LDISRTPWSGVGDHPVAAALHVYPNPATDEVSVDLGGSPRDALVMELLDPQGRLVVQRTLPPASGSVFKLSVAGLDNGAYLLQLYSPGTVRSERLIIAR